MSIPTLHKMEKGNPAISIGVWAEALRMFGRLEDWGIRLLIRKAGLGLREQTKINLLEALGANGLGALLETIPLTFG